MSLFQRVLVNNSIPSFCVVGLQTDDLCDHGGHCVNTGNTHYCKCPMDYTGSYCESQVDHCEDKPCLNGATCRGYVGGYTCDVSTVSLSSLINKWYNCRFDNSPHCLHVSVWQGMMDRTVRGRLTSAALIHVKTEEPASTWWATTSAPVLLAQGVG